MTWEPDSIYTTEVHAGEDDSNNNDVAIQQNFSHFLRTFTLDKVNIYREQLIQCIHDTNPYIEIDLDHLSAYNDSLGHTFFDRPAHCLQLMEAAAYDFGDGLRYHSVSRKPSGICGEHKAVIERNRRWGR